MLVVVPTKLVPVTVPRIVAAPEWVKLPVTT